MVELPIISFEDEAAWEHWLAQKYASSEGLWLKIAKKGAADETVTYAQALDVALCFGWIDGQKNKFDESYWLQKFTPRRKRSLWSKVNQEKVAVLTAAGRMREPGIQEIERAKSDRRWDAAYESQSRMTVSVELQKALDENPVAKAFFEQLNSVNRYAILHRVTTAKREETRQKRIAQYIEMLNAHKKIYE